MRPRYCPWDIPNEGEGGVRLNVGCGDEPLPGFLNADLDERFGDIHFSVEETWPFGDETFDYILASHLIEHLSPLGFLPFIKEAYRVLKKGGRLDVLTPHAADRNFFRDPTHVRGYTPATFNVYCMMGTPYNLPLWSSCYVEQSYLQLNDDIIECVNAQLIK